jgi:hypothetical protein
VRAHMSGSRGKGKRRGPWRDGGAHKQKRPEWRKQAAHAVEEPAELAEPLTCLQYRGRFREKPAHAIYRFDQRIVPTGIRYFPEYQGLWRGFAIHVSAEHQVRVEEILRQLDAEGTKCGSG